MAQVRQVLLGQLGQRNAEASLYQQVLDAAANHYPALSLGQMVGVTDASALFSNPAEVPGVFTRQAWEGQVRQAIDTIAEARRENRLGTQRPTGCTRHALEPAVAARASHRTLLRGLWQRLAGLSQSPALAASQ